MLGPEVDRTCRYAITGPIPATRQPWSQQVLPLHNPNIKGLAAFNRLAPTEGVSGHPQRQPRPDRLRRNPRLGPPGTASLIVTVGGISVT
jgi:hypothetical protein